MRALPGPIATALDSGVLIGDSKPQVRLTVEPDWFLTRVATNLGAWPASKSPVRYWQRAANDQVEIEVPNVVDIDIDRNVATPAASCTITIDNVWMDGNMTGRIDRLGSPGWFTPTRGATVEATARWGDAPNEWFGLLEENSLLRTYEGVGDDNEPYEDALAAGRLMLSGVWLVDDWRATSRGQLTLNCRDMMALLIDQIIYPPLVPLSLYPLTYYRWDYEDVPVNAGAVDLTITRPGGTIPAGDKRTVYVDSSVDRWYGYNFTLHGHRGTDSVDGNGDTFALSVGNSSPDRPFCTDWWEYDCGEEINAVYVWPWCGNYTAYISVMEDGRWQGDQIVPYDHTPLIGTQPTVVDTGADIPYVISVGVPWEQAIDIILPRIYRAQRVRIAFRDHTRSPWGPWYYRCGIREFRCKAIGGAQTATAGTTEHVTVPPFFHGAASLQDPDNPIADGYVTVSIFWQIDAFGDCRVLPWTGGDRPCSHDSGNIELTPSGDGYWVLCDSGHVACYGNAGSYGNVFNGVYSGDGPKPGVILTTPTGLGYWIVSWDGLIHNFGDATAYSPVSLPAGEFIVGGASHQTSHGLWIIASDGSVQVRGAATNFGSWSESTLTNTGQEDGLSEIAIDIQPTFDADGYWILSSGGRVQAFGAAGDFGQITETTESHSSYDRYFHLMPSPADTGYLILKGDGTIIPFGDVNNWGGPTPGGTAVARLPGNYLDYVDIVRDILLWSGYFFAFELNPDNGLPEVYGNLESTGAYAPDTLPLEMFDKKPPFDPIKQLAELVGYIIYVDEEGGFRFHTPNWWNFGNFYFDGTHTTEIHELDERWNLFDATVGSTRANDRSEIIISTEEPTEALDDTVTTRFVPPDQSRLRGMVRPAMWVQGALGDAEEQQTMAELVALHLWFRRRTATVVGLNHPGVSINDQIRILDRATGETSVHYVLSKATRFNRENREWIMELTTHWLGDRDAWALSLDGSTATEGGQSQFALTAGTLAVLERRGIYLEAQGDFVTHLVDPTLVPSGSDGVAT